MSSPSSSSSSAFERPHYHSGARQLYAMVRKNFLLKRRSPMTTLCEMLAPILIAIGLVYAYRLSLSSVVKTSPEVFSEQRLDIAPLIEQGLTTTSSQNLGSIFSQVFRTIYGYRGGLTPIPFDYFIGLSLLLRAAVTQFADPRTIRQLNSALGLVNAGFDNLLYLGTISFTPDTPEVRRLVSHFNSTYRFFPQVYDRIYASEREAVDTALDLASSPQANLLPYSGRMWALIVVKEMDFSTSRFDFKIRMNYTAVPSTKQTINKFNKGFDDNFKKYFYSGYLSIEAAVENYILTESRGRLYQNSTVDVQAQLQADAATRTGNGVLAIPFPLAETNTNPFYQQAGAYVGLVLCLGMLYPVSRLMKQLVEEKETRVKETMKMMGLKNWAYILSHFSTYFIIFFVIALISTLLLNGSFLSRTTPSLLFAYFFAFNMSMCNLGLMISTFFSRSKLAGIVGPVLIFALVMPRYAFLTSEEQDLIGYKYLSCLSSPAAFALGFDIFMSYESAELSLNWQSAADDPLSIYTIIGIMFIDIFLYGALFLYFEMVMPNEYGSHLKPWFLCTKKFWVGDHRKQEMGKVNSLKKKGSFHQLHDKDDEAPYELPEEFNEPVTSEEYLAKERVRIQSLYKRFDYGYGAAKRTVTAVNNLSMSMYEGQITCLLGHNGAGKSTTISILTGLISPSSGDALIGGYSIGSQMDEIRESLGVCPQTNVLFEQLTVREHLELYAALKGVKSNQVDKEIQRMIDDVGLTKKTNTQARSLSGGMKRKLCLANALLGDSAFVLIDEASSGVDPRSRREIWELIQKYKAGRVICLTTHFMDEADVLGDRIAILSHGKLRCLGSSLFLKTRFGMGYVLTIGYRLPSGENGHKQIEEAKEDHEHDHEAEAETALMPSRHSSDASTSTAPSVNASFTVPEVIFSHVPEAHALTNLPSEGQFQLPLESVGKFAPLFRELESRKDELAIQEFGVSMTTLEEVFIKIAEMGEEDYEQHQKDYGKRQMEVQKRLGLVGDGSDASSKPSVAIEVEGEQKDHDNENATVTETGSVGADSPTDAQSANRPTVAGSVSIELEMAAIPSRPNDRSVSRSKSNKIAPEPGHEAEGEKDETHSSSHSATPPGSTGATQSAAAPATESSTQQRRKSGPAVAPLTSSASPDKQKVHDDSDVPPHFQRDEIREPASFPVQFIELMRKRYLCMLRDPKNLFFQIILPVIVIILVLLILLIQIDISGPELELTAPSLQAKSPSKLQSYSFPSNVTFVTDQEAEKSTQNIPFSMTNMDSGLIYWMFQSPNPEADVYPPASPHVPRPLTPYVAKNSTELSYQLLDTYYGHGGARAAAIMFNDTQQFQLFNPNLTQTLALFGVRLFLQQANLTNTVLGGLAIEGGQVVLPNAPANSELVLENGNVTLLIGNTRVNLDSSAVNSTALNGALRTISTGLNNLNLTVPGTNQTAVFNITFDPNNPFPQRISIVLNGTQAILTVNNTGGFATAAIPTSLLLPGLVFNNGTLVVPFETVQNLLLANPQLLGANADLLLLLNLTFPRQSYSLLHNTSIPHAIPVFMSEMLKARLQLLRSPASRSLSPSSPLSSVEAAVQGSGDRPKSNYRVSSHPLPITRELSLRIQTLLYVLTALFSLIPFTYLPGSFVIFIVKERTSKAKHLQLVSGVHPVVYWVATYVWDILNWTVIITFVLCLYFMYNATAFIGDSSAAGTTFFVFLLYGMAVLPQSYLISMAFNNHSAAQVSVAGLQFLFGFILTIASFILDSLESTRDINEGLKPFYRLFPAFNFGVALTSLSARELFARFLGRSPWALDWEVTGRPLAYMGAEAVVYFLLVLFMEYEGPYKIWTPIERAIWKLIAMIEARRAANKPLGASDSLSEPLKPSGAEEEDIDVRSERLRMQRGGNKDFVQIYGLRKVFGDSLLDKLLRWLGMSKQQPTVAVKGVYLGIPKGECFGYLGANGAGKSTTMSMILGELRPTDGRAYVGGYDIVTQQEQLRKVSSYCPQHDPLLELMTGREHLEFIARVRNIPNVKETVAYLIEHLDLSKHADKVTESYSGGNKRKLALGLALVGAPSLACIDEPSSGVDSLSAKKLREVMKTAGKHCAIILTSHSMQECEALCQRVSIMAQGEMKCLGSVQHLKSRFGQAYELEINIEKDKDNGQVKSVQVDSDVSSAAIYDQFRVWLQSEWPDTQELEVHDTHVRYRIQKNQSPKDCPDSSSVAKRFLPLSELFEKMEQAKSKFRIGEFSISDTTLEQVFIHFIKGNRQLTEEEHDKDKKEKADGKAKEQK